MIKEYEQVLIAENFDYLSSLGCPAYDWSAFWDRFFLFEQNIRHTLFESFNLIDETEKSSVFEIEAMDLKFTLYVNILPLESLASRLMGSYVSTPEEQRNDVKVLLSLSKQEGYCLNVNFTDENNNVKQTHTAKNKAFIVLSSLKKAVAETLYKKGVKPTIMYFYIVKEDEKKLAFFLNTFKHICPWMKSTFIDSSDEKYNLVYVW